MQRKAIILSLGMLLEKVDTNGFIAKLLAQAKIENPDFNFTAALQGQAFMLSEKFNQKKVNPEEFADQLLQMLGIKNLEKTEFWHAWNQMVTLGNLAEKIVLLQDMAHKNGAIFYLITDTNVVHLKQLAVDAGRIGFEMDLTVQPMKLGQLPLYPSCHHGANRLGLIALTVADIRAKDIKMFDQVVLVYGNPENVKDKTHQAMAKKECDGVMAWCKQNEVTVQLHDNDLRASLATIFTENLELTNKLGM